MNRRAELEAEYVRGWNAGAKVSSDTAFRAGAEAMREAAAKRYDADDMPDIADDLRALPLPEAK